MILGVLYRGYFFSKPLSLSSIPEVESLVFTPQQHKTNSHTVIGITPHEIKISPPPKRKYSSKYLVVFLGKGILGAIEGKKYVYTFYNINLPVNITKGKSRKGDALVPIGDYYILKHELKGKTMYMTLNYPNSKDAARALKSKLITKSQFDAILAANKAGKLPPFDTLLGGPVMIRGDGIAGMNTSGNIGIKPEAMRKIWEFAKKGTPIRILP